MMPFSQMRLEKSTSEHHWTFYASKDRIKVKVSPTTGLLNKVLLCLFNKRFDIGATYITPSWQKLCTWHWTYCTTCVQWASFLKQVLSFCVIRCFTDASQNLIDILLFRINDESDSDWEVIEMLLKEITFAFIKVLILSCVPVIFW